MLTALRVSRAAPLFLNVSRPCNKAQSFFITSSSLLRKKFNFPLSPDEMPRAGGIATMMRLPHQKSAVGLDACFVGVPFDTGTSNKTGTRYGPRQIRWESSMLRPYNPATGAAPFESLMVADVGDIPINNFNISKTVDIIRTKIEEFICDGCFPLTMGGDHTITYPILQAIKNKHGPVGLVHVDAHMDLHNKMCDEAVYHGSPFFRAFEEGLLDPKRVVQIGLRGSLYDNNAYNIPKDLGFRVVPAVDCWYKSMAPLMAEVREQMGDGPVYISFDIDGLDPSIAPGTGTPEIGGLTAIQGLEIVRGCQGLNVVGGDLVEVSPPYDTTGITALTGANLLFEMLCVLPGVKYYKH